MKELFCRMVGSGVAKCCLYCIMFLHTCIVSKIGFFLFRFLLSASGHKLFSLLI